MKKILLIVLCLAVITSSAAAAVFESVAFDIENSTITVSGNTGKSINGRVMTLLVLNSGETVNTTQNNIEHMDILSVNLNGEYVHKFGFSGKSGSYVFMAFDGDTIEEKKTVNYYSRETLDSFAKNIAEGKLTTREIEDGLKMYGESLGADMEYFSDLRNHDVLISAIQNGKADMIGGLSSALSKVIADAKYECELLDKIEECKIWYEVEDYLKDNASLINIDFVAYDKCTDKSKVCSAFIGVETKSLAALSEKFNDLVRQNSRSDDSSGGRGGSSGSSGSSKHSISSNVSSAGNVVTPLPKVVFNDIENVPWAKTEILVLSEKGILSGLGNGVFNPDGPVTREQAAKIISMAFGFSSENPKVKFEDADVNSWYYPYVASLYENGIISGISDTHFGVGQGITRQDLAVILYRVMNKKGYSLEALKNDFKDFDIISEYAKQAVSFVAGAGIINGMETGCFNPHDGATRAQMAKLVYNMLNFVK